MNRITLTLIYFFALAVSTAHAEEVRQYSSQAAALAALTAPSHADAKVTGKSDSASEEEDEDDIQEIPADAPTTSNVQVNIPVAGETGQL